MRERDWDQESCLICAHPDIECLFLMKTITVLNRLCIDRFSSTSHKILPET